MSKRTPKCVPLVDDLWVNQRNTDGINGCRYQSQSIHKSWPRFQHGQMFSKTGSCACMIQTRICLTLETNACLCSNLVSPTVHLQLQLQFSAPAASHSVKPSQCSLKRLKGIKNHLIGPYCLALQGCGLVHQPVKSCQNKS